MFLKADILFLFAETPIHAGSGSGLGAVDMPIQRERRTAFPIIQSSGIKGALRQYMPNGADQIAVFGPESADHAGAFATEDAHLLLFPVRSLRGVFAWITCQSVLARFQRQLVNIGHQTIPPLPNKGEELDKGSALVASDALLLGNQIMLEEFDFKASEDKGLLAWAKFLSDTTLPSHDVFDYWQNHIRTHLVLLPEDDFRDFVRYSTEVVTRIRLSDETKTVESGALFTQELLPAESLLYTTIHTTRLRMPLDEARKSGTTLSRTKHNESGEVVIDADQEAEAVLDWLRLLPRIIQIGGDETIGRGLVNTRWLGEES